MLPSIPPNSPPMGKNFTEQIVKAVAVALILTVVLGLGCTTATATTTTGPSKRCLENVPESKFKRLFYVDQNLTSINIEVSSRTSHQITSRIFRIIIREVLDYENVSFTNTSEAINSYTFCSLPSFLAPSNSMINLEAWVPILYNLQNLEEHANVESVGPLGALGRFAWYIPSNLLDERWKNHSVNLQCGQSLKQSHIDAFISPAMFHELKGLIEARRNKTSFHLLCGGNSVCSEGIYYSSDKCRTKPDSCPILVTSFYRNYGSCLMSYIKNSHLDVIVMWIGNGVYDYVLNKTKEGVPVMYFGWNLDLLSTTDLFSPIHMPPVVRQPESRGVDNCDWQVRPIHKMVWSKLRVYAPEVYQMLTNLEFSNSQMSDMLRSYREFHEKESNKMTLPSKEKVLEEIACGWVKENEQTWREWLPPKDSKIPIYIGGLFSSTGKAMRDFSAIAAAQLAAELINNDPNILPNHSIEILVADTASVPSRKVNSITAFMTNKTHRVMGLLDTSVSTDFEELVGSMSSVYSIPLIAHNSKSFALSQRNTYPYFFRINSIFMDKAFALPEMFEKFNWKRVGLFIEDSPSMEGYHNFFREFLGSRNINVAFDSKVPSIVDLQVLSDSLDQLKKKRVNIIVVALEMRNMLAFLCQIYDKKMASSNNYSWLFMTLNHLVDNWWNVNNSQFYQMKTAECTQSKITEALQSHFFFHNTQQDPDKDKVVIGNKTSMDIFNEISHRLIQIGKTGINPVSSEAFDAILVYGKAFHQLLLENSSALVYLQEDSTLRRFVQIVESLQFDGMTGPIKFKGADRSGIVEILQMQSDDFVRVGFFRQEQNNLTANGLDIPSHKLVWRTASGRAPSDSLDVEKACGVETIRALLGVECDVAIIIINVTVFGIVLVPIILFLAYIKKKYDAKMKEIEITPQIAGWELTRNEIILNRNIGQGEFGAVFGGEAKIKQTWVAVAVKTLKPGSTPDHKVDFFSEARLMKDFNHENIVKLVGVCSIGHPGLVVMEFMLHGDLRSYLLSRRHLVNETSEEAMDVGPQAITKMALDIANGLKYLTNLGFIHRDLACRNCLVHQTGIVKIGDFGLTENVYNSGYVRCVSNGKFPVRWMAPESLREGVFSFASDIWSFGVLMYEIFTFGALPYHGFTNEQVVIFVKNRKTISLPPGCPENLEKLLRECWSYESDKRPTIYVIIDHLERMPLLLVPCLDVPRPQVGLDGSAGNNGLIVNFMDPVVNKGSNVTKSQKSSAMNKHKSSLSGMSLLNNSKQIRFTNPEKSPDICSPQSTSAHCFDFASVAECQLDLIEASDTHSKKWKEDSFDRCRENVNALRNASESGNETKALLCNGCERSSTAPVLHRSVSTEPKVTAIFKKLLDAKENLDITTDASGWTCKVPGGTQPGSLCHQQNKRHSRKKNSAVSSSPAL